MSRLPGCAFRWVFAGLTSAIIILLSLVLDLPGRTLSAQPVVFTIRPTSETDVVLIGNPQYARDTSEVSAAGGSWGRVCHTNCENPIVAKATWLRIPGGYRPLALEVKWRAASSMALYGYDTAEVKATLQYNLGSGWSPWIEYTWFATSAPCPTPPDGGITCADHIDSLTLPSAQRTDTIQVQLSESVRLTHCDNCWIRVSNVTGTLSVYDIRVKADECYLPIGETTVGDGWGTGDQETNGKFRQTLIPEAEGLIFDGRKVTETDPGGGGPDTCYYPGSPYLPLNKITGGTWWVNSGNTWLYDYVGYFTPAVTHYRQHDMVPCETSFPQQMGIDCGSVYVSYTTNTLRAGIDQLTVWSERAGVYQLRVWP